MAIVKKYKAEVVSVNNSIEGVYTVEFRSLDKAFRYDPGQFLHLALDAFDPAGQWPDSRCFSMQSSPNEELIRITYAIKGSFTSQMVAELKPGIEVILKLPYGDLFTQQHAKSNNVFIAGGTGITPFLSLFTHSSFALYNRPVLYAGFRNQKMNLYANELSKAKEINPSLEWHFVYEDSNGRLNIQEIFENSKSGSTYFISGPPVMIKSFKDYLLQANVGQNWILTDDWE
ncbi:MAG: FAD-dependent oxidoreductase [Bacteroidales bacterium]|nr:FAD-dependent oxidoreductase [Bacteroidales bacterium]